MRRRDLLLPVLGAALVAAVAGGLSAQPPGSFGGLTRAEAVRYIAWAGAAGAAYAGAVWLVLRRPAGRGGLAAILVAGVAARLLVLGAPPVLSTDIYRYVWDGRVQAAGINPYLYFPVDPALAPLRDAGDGPAAVFRNINRADTAPTIYPPAAQALFGITGLLGGGVWTMKGAMLAFDLVSAGLVLLLLRTAGRPAAQVLVWAWNPLVIWEFAGAGHVDAMALAFTAAALAMAARSRMGWAGLALGLAVLTKLLPAALFPAFWRRWDLRVAAAAGLVVVAGYAAYASAGWKVLGYLGGYAQEEQLQDGGGFLLLRLASLAGPLPGWAGRAYAVAGLALLGGRCALGGAAPLAGPAWRPCGGAVRGRAASVGHPACRHVAALPMVPDDAGAAGGAAPFGGGVVADGRGAAALPGLCTKRCPMAGARVHPMSSADAGGRRAAPPA